MLRGKAVWCVCLRRTDGTKRRSFHATQAAAKADAGAHQDQIRKTGETWVAMSATERAEVLAIVGEAAAKGVSLRVVWEDWKRGLQRVEEPTGPALGAAIEECLASKRAGNRREGYVKDLGLVLAAFARGRKNLPVAKVTASEIEEWIAGKYENLHSRSTVLNRINTLFSFAVRRGHRRDNPCDRIERITIDHQAPEIMTPEDAAKLMAAVRAECPRGLAWFALALFAGIRPEECDKLIWSAVDLARGIVQVDAAAAKVRQRRIVSLQPAAIAWLRVAQASGADLPIPNVTRRRMQRDLRGTMGWEAWPQDILRHTAASYWLAEVQDAGKVAHELGNSAGILLRHYRELVTREDASRFWAIRPSGDHPTPDRGVHPNAARRESVGG
jgi:site-specific recombinase XerC